ncbi:beta-N-acetylhexosaminidase [Chitinophaga defluvii]|uniref:beta-N-acetylhexosaminidase n=1 Tax=Chitinophaga defluvii TaxID=3163343 RepID=A0ABV2T5H0_9BACT
MRKLTFLIFSAMVMWHGVVAQPEKQKQVLHIIPEPVSTTVLKGSFLLKPNTRIVVSGKDVSGVASLLTQMLNAPTGYQLATTVSKGGQEGNAIVLRINSSHNAALGEEGYTLQVLPKQVVVAANKPQGLFYGIQTLMQLLPPVIGSHTVVKDTPWKIPCVNITDHPRFGWRGLMLDVSRHFFSKAFVKQYIDEIARYKFNVFHWHLSDDQGWRIEIKGLPELTTTGAWRVPRSGKWWSFAPPQPGEKATAGGYYTQEDIREVVAYAKERFVTIVPEIDVPAHCLALIASYPELSCTQQKYDVNPGSRFLKKEINNVLCVANDSTWLILDKVFTQLAALFPGEYIHVGGDEAHKSFWETCPKDLALAKKLGVTIQGGLQPYFEKKMHQLIVSKGKKMMGWDEILHDGLPTDIAVMSWRGMNPGINAAKQKHPVVMSPWGQAYLDLYQGDPLIEPNTYGMLRLKTCYDFNPLPDSVDPKYILGGQGNLWTESVPNERQVAYMTWPRSLALAEVFWSPAGKNNWPDFIRRVEQQFKYMDAAQVKYARSMYDPIIDVAKGNNDSLNVTLASEIPGVDVYYAFDGTNPDNFYPRYTGTPLDIPKGASEIRVITYRGQQPIGQQINCPLSLLQQKLDKKIKREMQQKSK